MNKLTIKNDFIGTKKALFLVSMIGDDKGLRAIVDEANIYRCGDEPEIKEKQARGQVAIRSALLALDLAKELNNTTVTGVVVKAINYKYLDATGVEVSASAQYLATEETRRELRIIRAEISSVERYRKTCGKVGATLTVEAESRLTELQAKAEALKDTLRDLVKAEEETSVKFWNDLKADKLTEAKKEVAEETRRGLAASLAEAEAKALKENKAKKSSEVKKA